MTGVNDLVGVIDFVLDALMVLLVDTMVVEMAGVLDKDLETLGVTDKVGVTLLVPLSVGVFDKEVETLDVADKVGVLLTVLIKLGETLGVVDDVTETTGVFDTEGTPVCETLAEACTLVDTLGLPLGVIEVVSVIDTEGVMLAVTLPEAPTL